MEASWKGGCCEEQVVIVLGLHQCRGPFPRGPLPSPISTQCEKCGCWFRKTGPLLTFDCSEDHWVQPQGLPG